MRRALLGLAQAQCGYDVPLCRGQYREQAWRRRCFRFEDEIVAIERHLDALQSGQFERFRDRHSRSLDDRAVFSLRSRSG
jgi:hypothetical protein